MAGNRSYYKEALRLRADLWRLPFLMCVWALLFFLATISVDRAAARGNISLPRWISVGGVDDARAILGAMLGAVSTVLALIFSVALLVFSIAMTQFGPRILHRFLRDGVTQGTIGLFLASFIYCLLTFVVTRGEASGHFVPQLTIMFCVVGVITSFVFLVIFSHRIGVSIQTQTVVASIVADLAEAIREMIADRKTWREPPRTPGSIAERERLLERFAAEGGVVAAGRTGFIADVDVLALVNAGDAAGIVVRFLYRPGQFVLKGSPLFQVLPASKATAVSASLIRTVKIRAHRTLRQDLEFGTAQLVEIALRALSPAINDTFTGLTCIDWLGDELRAFAAFQEAVGLLLGSNGDIRVVWSPLRFERLVKTAFDQIRQAGIGNPAVRIRLLQTFARLARLTDNVGIRQALVRQVEAVWESVSNEPIVSFDRADIEKEYKVAREALGL